MVLYDFTCLYILYYVNFVKILINKYYVLQTCVILILFQTWFQIKVLKEASPLSLACSALIGLDSTRSHNFLIISTHVKSTSKLIYAADICDQK